MPGLSVFYPQQKSNFLDRQTRPWRDMIGVRVVGRGEAMPLDPTVLSWSWVVAALFLEEPPLALAGELVQGRLNLPGPLVGNGKLAEGLAALSAFANAQAGREAEQVHHELCQEYAALFVGPWPRTVHPYESVYRDSLTVGGQTFRELLMGESVDKVRTFWAEVGVQGIHPRNYPPDHFGMELGFVAYLGQQFLETGQERYLELARRFLQEHLLAWGPRFCTDLYALDAARFYKPVARLAEVLLATLAQQFDAGAHR